MHAVYNYSGFADLVARSPALPTQAAVPDKSPREIIEPVATEQPLQESMTGKPLSRDI